MNQVRVQQALLVRLLFFDFAFAGCKLVTQPGAVVFNWVWTDWSFWLDDWYLWLNECFGCDFAHAIRVIKISDMLTRSTGLVHIFVLVF